MGKIKGWKTLAANGIMFLVYSLQWDMLTQYVSPEMIANLTIALNAALRFVTTGPVGFKKEA